MDELTPEKIEAIYKWLETEPGQRYTEHSKKISELVEQQKKIIYELLTWLENPIQNNTVSFNLIGKFMVKFSHIEALMRTVFGIESRVHSSFKETLMMTFDFTLLVNTLKSFYEDKLKENITLQKRIISALNLCLSINTDRVKVAHGTWVLNENEVAMLIHLKRGALSSDIHFGDQKELFDLIKRTEDACKQFVSVLFEVFEYTSLAE